MEALAEPGKAYLTESDRGELARGFLELEDLGEFEIKGASRPVRVFELAGIGAARSRLDLSRERGFSQLRRPRGGDRRCSRRRWSGRGPGRGRRGRDRRRSRRRQEPPLPRVRRALPRRRDRGLRGAGPGARTRDPVHAGAADAARLLRDRRRRRRSGSCARRSPAGRCCSTPSSPTSCRCCSTSSASPTRPGRAPQLSAEARQRALRSDRLPSSSALRTGASRSVIVVEDLHWIDERQRGDARRAVRRGRGHADPGRRQLPARVRDRTWSGPPDYHEIALAPLGTGRHGAS